jgi:hypothetical protein
MVVTAGIFLASILLKEMRYLVHTAISIKVVPRAKRNSRIRARKALGVAGIRLFRFARGTTLIEIAV